MASLTSVRSPESTIRAKGVVEGVTFSANGSLRRQKESKDRDGRKSVQEDELQYRQITGINSIVVRPRNKGVVMVLGALMSLGGFLGLLIVNLALEELPQPPLSGSIGLLLLGVLVLAGGFSMRKRGYYQVVAPSIGFDEAKDWQIMRDKNGEALVSRVNIRLQAQSSRC